jgi:hypothetical protein
VWILGARAQFELREVGQDPRPLNVDPDGRDVICDPIGALEAGQCRFALAGIPEEDIGPVRPNDAAGVEAKDRIPCQDRDKPRAKPNLGRQRIG